MSTKALEFKDFKEANDTNFILVNDPNQNLRIHSNIELIVYDRYIPNSFSGPYLSTNASVHWSYTRIGVVHYIILYVTYQNSNRFLSVVK